MKSAIITGAFGFVGRHLAAHLKQKGVHTIAYDSRKTSPDTLPTADVFYHLAWEGATGPRRYDAGLQAKNAMMTLEALQAAYECGCKKFIALGTVYEKFAPRIKEQNEFRSADFYILSKNYAHETSNQLAHKLGIDFAWCTICHPIGRFIKPEQMMAFLISNLLAGTPPDFGACKTYFDIVAVSDVALGLGLLGNCDKLKKREYYIGSPDAKPLYVWLEEVRDILKTDTPINFLKRTDDGVVLDKSWFNIGDLVCDTGYSPKISFDEAVKSVAEYIADSGEFACRF